MATVEINMATLVESIERNMNIFSKGKDVKIKYFSGYKPAGYYVPCVLSYLEKEPRKPEKTWFCEVFFNNICIYREQTVNDGKLSDAEIETLTIKRLITSIFMYSFYEQYKFTLKLKSNADH